MFITDRGTPPLSLVLWVLLGGYLMAGGANTVNMWFDRDIDTLMSRTRLRPIPSGRIPAWAALLFGLGAGRRGLLDLLALRQSAQRLAGIQRLPLLRLHLHCLAQAAHGAEHRDRRRGRRLPSPGRLDGHDGKPGPPGDLPLRHHLLLDAASLLGPGAHQAAGLRQRRRPDDAGGRRRALDQDPDARLHR